MAMQVIFAPSEVRALYGTIAQPQVITGSGSRCYDNVGAGIGNVQISHFLKLCCHARNDDIYVSETRRTFEIFSQSMRAGLLQSNRDHRPESEQERVNESIYLDSTVSNYGI